MSRIIFLVLVLITFGISYGRENSTSYNEDPDAYRGRAMGEGEECSNQNCPTPPNFCASSGNIHACICGDDYANYPFFPIHGQYCTYERKKQIVAFLWEIINLGIGHYYIGNTLRGIFKTIVMAVPFLILLGGKLRLVKYKTNEGTTGIVMFIIMCVFFLAAFIWWLVDLILFGLNKYRDGNDVPLKHW